MKTIHEVIWLIHKYIEFGEVDTAEKVLKDYGDSIVDECLDQSAAYINGACADIDISSILQVKDQIK